MKSFYLKLTLVFLSVLMILSACSNEKGFSKDNISEILDELENSVEVLWDKQGNDLAADIDSQELERIEEAIKHGDNSYLSKEEKERFVKIKNDFEEIIAMVNLESLLNDLVENQDEIDEVYYETIKEGVESFISKKGYYTRLKAELENVSHMLDKQLALDEMRHQIEDEITALKNKETINLSEIEAVKRAVSSLEDEEVIAAIQKEMKSLDEKVSKESKESTELASEKSSREESKDQASTSKDLAFKDTEKDKLSHQVVKGDDQTKKKEDKEVISIKPSMEEIKEKNDKQSKLDKDKFSSSEDKSESKGGKQKETIVDGRVGNSEKVFKTIGNAENWAKNNENDGENWKSKGYRNFNVNPIIYGYLDEEGKLIETTRTMYTVDFYK